MIFLREFLNGGKWKQKFQFFFFWKHGTVNEFHGATDISFQMRGAEFPVIHGLEKSLYKLPLLHTATCTSTSTRHVTLKSHLLLQFPCRLSCAVQKPYLLILGDLRSNNRQKKETLRFSNQHFAHKRLFKREIFHSYKQISKVFQLF